MTHRYLRPAWWIVRLLGVAESVLAPALTMPAEAWTAARFGERELARLRDWVPRDRLAIDVGANRGLYTCRLRRLAREVHAFEPQPELAGRLRCGLPDITVHACALSDHTGTAELRMPVVNGVAYQGWGTVEPENRLAAVDHASIRSVSVELRTLDSFDLADVGFMKIDVEGHELAVLRGAAATLRRCRPLILVEVDDRHRPGAVQDLRDWLARLDYSLTPAISPAMWLGTPD